MDSRRRAVIGCGTVTLALLGFAAMNYSSSETPSAGPSSPTSLSSPTNTPLQEEPFVFGNGKPVTLSAEQRAEALKELAHFGSVELSPARSQKFVTFRKDTFNDKETLLNYVNEFYAYINHPAIRVPELQIMQPSSSMDFQPNRADEFLRINIVEKTGTLIIVPFTKNNASNQVSGTATLHSDLLSGSADRKYRLEIKQGNVTISNTAQNVLYARPEYQLSEVSTIGCEVLHDGLRGLSITGIGNAFVRATKEMTATQRSDNRTLYDKFDEIGMQWIVEEEGLVHALALDWVDKNRTRLGVPQEELALARKEWYAHGRYSRVPHYTSLLKRQSPQQVMSNFIYQARK